VENQSLDMAARFVGDWKMIPISKFEGKIDCGINLYLFKKSLCSYVLVLSAINSCPYWKWRPFESNGSFARESRNLVPKEKL
jgi:hypothetical protein